MNFLISKGFIFIFIFLLLFSGLSLYAQERDIEQYLDFYSRELDTAIGVSNTVNDFSGFIQGLEKRMYVLRASWEMDRERLKAYAREVGDGDTAEGIDESFDHWEDEVEKRLSGAKAAFLVKHADVADGSVEELRKTLIEAFSKKYEEFFGAGADKKKAALFQEFNDDLIARYKDSERALEDAVSGEYDKLERIMTAWYPEENIGPSDMYSALQTERKNRIYEEKAFLARLVSSYTNRASRMLFSDSGSLRLDMETEHARRVAQEIEYGVEKKLDESVDSRLEQLLRQDVRDEADARMLSDRLQVYYEEGLELWAHAAAELLRRENEWYENYRQVYDEGIEAWTSALKTLQRKREQWSMAFHETVEEARVHWDENLAADMDARHALMESLVLYREDAERGFDAYIDTIGTALESGTDSVGQLDGYIGEFQFMLEDSMSAIVPDDCDLSNESYASLGSYIERIVSRGLGFGGSGTGPISNREMKFWEQDRSLTDIFELETHFLKVEHGYSVTKTDSILGHSYALVSKKKGYDGFTLRVKITADIRRWYLSIRAKKGGSDQIVARYDDEIGETRYFDIQFFETDGRWRKDIVNYLDESPEDFSVPVQDIELGRMAEDAKRYAGVIDDLQEKKQEMLERILAVQDAIIAQFEEKPLLENPVLIDDNAFKDYFLNDEPGVVLSDLEKELYTAYLDRSFWKEQFSIVEAVLSYAFDGTGRESAGETEARYADAKEAYLDAFEEYRLLLEHDDSHPGVRNLEDAENEISLLTTRLATAREEFSNAELELRKALDTLTNMNIADAKLETLVHTMFYEVSRAYEMKNANLTQLLSYDEEKGDEAAGNLLHDVLAGSKEAYERIIDAYFNKENRESLSSMRDIQNTFNSLFGAAEYTKESLQEKIGSLRSLASNMEESGLFSDILRKMDDLEAVLVNVADSMTTGETVSEAAVIDLTGSEISGIDTLFSLLCDAREDAYTEYYEHSTDPLGRYTVLLENTFREYLKDCREYARVQGEKTSESMSVNTGRDYWERLDGLLEDFENRKDSLHSVESYLILIRETDRNGFLILKNFFYTVLPGISDDDRHVYFIDSQKAGHVCRFFEDLLGDAGTGVDENSTGTDTGIGPGETSPSPQQAFHTGYRQALSVIDAVSRLDAVEEAVSRLDAGFYSGQKSSIQPIHGNLDTALLTLVLNMELFENGMLDAKQKTLLQTMADFCASSIYLLNESAFEEVENDNQALSERIIEKTKEYFGDLVEHAGQYGFDDQEIGCIKTNMTQLLLYTEEEGHNDIKRLCSSLSAKERAAFFQDVQARTAELRLFEQAEGYDIEGYFTLMLDEVRFKGLSDLEADLFLELKTREEYLREKEYAEMLGDFLQHSTMTSLRAVLGSAYTAKLLESGNPEAVERIERLCFYYVRQNLLGSNTDFGKLYRFIEEELVSDVVVSLTVGKKERDEIAGTVLTNLLLSCKMQEARIYQGGDTEASTVFSEYALPWAAALSRIESAIRDYKDTHGIYENQASFDAFISFIQAIDIAGDDSGGTNPGEGILEGSGGEGMDPYSDLTDGEKDLLRARYVDEACWDYAGTFFVARFDDKFQSNFLQNYDPGFQEFLLAENIFQNTVSLDEARELYVFQSPPEASFHDILSALLHVQAVLDAAISNSGFRTAMEKRLEELALGRWEDYRGVMFENRGVFQPNLDMSRLKEDTKPDEVSCAYNTVVLGNTSPDSALDRVYFEGYGDYEYTFGSENTGKVKTAPTFVSGSYGLNSYIEFQNRFVQVLLSLAGLSALSGTEGERLTGALEHYGIPIDHFNSLDIFRNPAFKTIDTIGSEGVLDLHSKTDLLSYYTTQVSTSDAAYIMGDRFSDNELLYLIASVSTVEIATGNLAEAISKAEEEASYRESEVQRLKSAVIEVETEIDTARRTYSEIVEDVNLQKQTVGNRYRDYLEAKEVYFYAKNIYLADDTGQNETALYKTQLLDYNEKLGLAEARFELLKEMKIQGERAVLEAGDMTDAFSGDELAYLAGELAVQQESVNRARKASFMLEILHALIDNELRMLEGEVDAMIQSREDPDTPEELKINFDVKIAVRRKRIEQLKGIDRQYTSVNLTRGSLAYEIMSKGLENAGVETRTEQEDYIYFLRDFIALDKGKVFNNTIEPSIGMMVVELKDYVRDQSSVLETLLEDVEKRYQERYQDFFENRFSQYTASVSKKETYALEEEVTRQEISNRLAGLTGEERKVFEQYLSHFSGAWDAFEPGSVDEKYRALLLLARRKEQAGELRLVYTVLTGCIDEEELTADEVERWGTGLSGLKEKYGIEEEDVVRFEDVVEEGAVFEAFDFSAGRLSETERKKELFEEVSDLGYFSIMFGEDLFIDILSDIGSIESTRIADSVALERYRFDLQLGSMVSEKARFFEKTDRGELNGIEAWDKQMVKLKGAYRKWIGEMRTRFSTAGEKWHEKEVEYVKAREQWLQDVSGERVDGENEIDELEQAVLLLAGDTGMDMDDMRIRAEALENEYIEDVSFPQWITNYEILANRTFGRLRNTGLSNAGVEEAIEGLRTRIEAFDEKKEELEAERLYYQLKKAREQILAGIRGLDRANSEMLEEFLTGEDVGFSKKAGGYEKKFVVDYSLLGGKKKETVRIREFGSYIVPHEMFRLAGIDELKSAGNSTNMKIFVMMEVERLRHAKEKVLGTAKTIGDIYREHIGRLPTEEDTARYVRENSSPGLFGALSGFVGKLMGELASVFGGEEETEGNRNFSEYQMLLVGEISYTQNKPLETGRIMLEYQRYAVTEAEALAKEYNGFLDKPLIPGGPSLKSIGNVTAAIATAGTSLLAQTAVQVGWSAFTTSTTALEGKIDWDEAGLDMLKSTVASFGSFGLSSLTAGIKGGIDLGSGFGSRVTNAGIDSTAFIADSAFSSMVNAVNLNSSNRLRWSPDSFETGFGMGLAGSFGTFGGSYVASSFDVMHGASWSDGGYNYNVLEDASSGNIIADYYNYDMKRMGDLLGGLTEQSINNLSGTSEGFTLNVLNAADFGGRNEVGMLALTLGDDDGFSWDVSTVGLNLAAYNLSRTMAGLERVDLYDAQYVEVDVAGKQNYTAGNLMRYVSDAINTEGVAALAALLERGELSGFDYSTEGISLYDGGEDVFVNNTGLLQWDLNSAAKYTSYMAYASENEYEALYGEGRKDRAEYMITEKNARENAVESDTLLRSALDSSESMLGNRMESVDFSLQVWEGLKERFNVADGAMDYYYAVFEYGGDGFERFKEAQGQFMGGKNVGGMIAELEGIGNEMIAVIASMYKGAIEARGSGLIEELIERGVMAKGYLDIVKEIALGRQLTRDEYDRVKETEIIIRDDLSTRADIEGYFLLSQLQSGVSTGVGGMLLQRYGYTDSLMVKSGLNGSEYVEVTGSTEQELGESIERAAAGLQEVIANPYILTERIFGDVFEGLRGESEWAKENKDPVRFVGADGKESVYLPGRSGTALCNYFGGNVLAGTYAMLGETDYVKDEWYPRRQGEAKYERIADTDLYYTKLAEDINEFIQEGAGKEYFTRADELVDMKGMSAEEFNDAVDGVVRKGFLPVWSWDNLGGGSSHIFVQTLGGQRWDVNYGSGEDQFAPVPLTVWKSQWLSKQFSNFLNTAMQYGRFDFKDEWVTGYEKERNYSKAEAERKYVEKFGAYDYDLSFSNYSVLMTMDLDAVWDYVIDHKKLMEY